MTKRHIGTSTARKEGVSKVTGSTHYVDDAPFQDIVYGATVRSQIPRGKIKKITFPKGDIPWDDFVIVTADDIPGHNFVALIENDQPYLAKDIVNHPEEPILILGHADKHLVEKARAAVHTDYEKLPTALSIDDSRSQKQIIWKNDNVFKRFLIENGDVEKGMKSAAKVVEGVYRTGAQEQLYIENNGMVAQYSKDDGVTVWGSLQCPYYVHKALKSLFNLSDDKVRVVQLETGGGFGGKEEYPSMIAGHAALLAMKSGKTAKIIYDRAEDLAATTKRHPSETKHRTAVDGNGKIIAMDIDFSLDGGAYMTLSPVVLSRGTLHAAGPYFCPNVRIQGCAFATNHPPHGAFRGFGAPQSIFAIERHFDKVAKAVGLTPDEFRRRNFIKNGDKTATGQVIKDNVDMVELLDATLRSADYDKKRSEYTKFNKSSRGLKKAIGFASFMHGAGFTGSGERNLKSKLDVRYDDKQKKFVVLASSTEIGQGTNTIFSQIAAENLTLGIDDIVVAQPDTKFVPDSGPTVASRTCMVVGKLVERACLDIKEKIRPLIRGQESRETILAACDAYVKSSGALSARTEYQPPSDVYWDDKTYRGDAYATYAWAVYVADVEIDLVSYQITVKDFLASQEVGKVINPVLAAGQIEGGVVQAIGYAIMEKVVWKDGRMANNRLTNYIIPTAVDVPLIKVRFHEQPTRHGPSGAKGIGELPMDGTAPAIVNAVSWALDEDFDHIPLMPEDIGAQIGEQ